MTERLHFHFSLSCIRGGNGNPLQCSCLENPRDGEPGGLPSLGSHRVGHDWSDLAAAVSNSLRPHGLQPTRLLCPWDFPGKSTGVGCYCLLCGHSWVTSFSLSRVLNNKIIHSFELTFVALLNVSVVWGTGYKYSCPDTHATFRAKIKFQIDYSSTSNAWNACWDY